MSIEGQGPDSAPAPVIVEDVSQGLSPVEVAPQEAQPPEPQKPAVDERLAKQFAALSRKEKQIKQQEAQFKLQQQTLQQERDTARADNERLKQEFDGYRSSIKSSPLQKLREEHGYDFETLTKMQLNDENPTSEMLLDRKANDLETKLTAKIEALEKALAEKEQKVEQEQMDRALNQVKRNITEHLGANPDKYELTTLNGQEHEVFNVIEVMYETHGKLLSVEEAADYVEKYLEDEANKIFKAKKFAARAPAPKTPALSEKPASVTLSNNLQAEVPLSNKKVLSRDEQIAEAAKVIKWGN